MAAHSGSRWGTVEETIELDTSLNETPRSSSRFPSAAPSSSAVDSRTVAKRQCSRSSSPRKVPKWVWVLPTSTTSSMEGDYADRMRVKLYALPASHPCAAVEVALRCKGIEYERVDWLPM